MPSNLVNMLKNGGNPLVSVLRGQPVFRRVPRVPEDPMMSEIQQLKDQGVPLRKILSGLDSVGKPELKNFAQELFNKAKSSLTRVDVGGGQPGFRQQSPEFGVAPLLTSQEDAE